MVYRYTKTPIRNRKPQNWILLRGDTAKNLTCLDILYIVYHNGCQDGNPSTRLGADPDIIIAATFRLLFWSERGGGPL